jgi:predicted Zn-dependent protease
MEKARVAAERFSHSSNPYFLDTLGWFYFREGKVLQAQPILERAMVTANPVPPQMQYHYGSLLFKSERLQEAKFALSKALVEGANYPGIDEAKKLLNIIDKQNGP